MGNKKSTSRQPVVKDEKETVINLVMNNDEEFSQALVRKIPMELHKIQTWQDKELWFYDPPPKLEDVTPTNMWKSGYLVKFHQEKLIVTIRVGYKLYKQALWKVFTKWTPGVPTPEMWKERNKDVGLGTIEMDVIKKRALKF